MTALLVEAGAQRSQSPIVAWEARGDVLHMGTICPIARRIAVCFLGPAGKACNAALSSHLNPSAIVSLQHRPYGSAKLSPRQISSTTLTKRTSLRWAGLEAIESGLDRGREKAGETRRLII